MTRKLYKEKLKGVGFVEALIALTVSGIVAIVLMSISAEAIRELRKLDMQDAIAQHAVSTAVHIQNLAIAQATGNPEGNIFLYLNTNKCYTFDKYDGSLITEWELDPGTMNRSDYENSVIEPDSEFFRLMCVEHSTESDRRKILVKIIVGSNRVAGRVTNDTDVKDYEHFAIINL